MKYLKDDELIEISCILFRLFFPGISILAAFAQFLPEEKKSFPYPFSFLASAISKIRF